LVTLEKDFLFIRLRYFENKFKLKSFEYFGRIRELFLIKIITRTVRRLME
jgi:hypothetical protein